MSTTEKVKVKSKGIKVYCKQKSELHKTFKNNPTTQHEKYIKSLKLN